MEIIEFNAETDIYWSENFVARREDGTTPNGNQMGWQWVLRTSTGDYIDHDRYRHDLFARHDLKVKYWEGE